ncbi:4Fe-4S binding protein [Inediibacterium massiliense]|uniref:4Fe-4S binding protein n=1 Tax=Inediibacterium massiliense TaxID=1658111 RepID=UPI000B04F3AF|nr:4Fe-4S binding protein [Inediibacterium massiliense]
MNRPIIKKFHPPKHIKDYPIGTSFQAGHLVEKNAGWRTIKPVIDYEKCVKCMICYLYCPEGTIFKENEKIQIDYDFCKGCGICAKECKAGSIQMVREERK